MTRIFYFSKKLRIWLLDQNFMRISKIHTRTLDKAIFTQKKLQNQLTKAANLSWACSTTKKLTNLWNATQVGIVMGNQIVINECWRLLLTWAVLNGKQHFHVFRDFCLSSNIPYVLISQCTMDFFHGWIAHGLRKLRTKAEVGWWLLADTVLETVRHTFKLSFCTLCSTRLYSTNTQSFNFKIEHNEAHHMQYVWCKLDSAGLVGCCTGCIQRNAKFWPDFGSFDQCGQISE